LGENETLSCLINFSVETFAVEKEKNIVGENNVSEPSGDFLEKSAFPTA